MTTTALSSDDRTSRAIEAKRARPWRRSHAAAGVAFVAIEIACIAVQGGSTPSRHSSTATIARFFRDHARSVEVSEILAALGLAALLWWFGGFWQPRSPCSPAPLG